MLVNEEYPSLAKAKDIFYSEMNSTHTDVLLFTPFVERSDNAMPVTPYCGLGYIAESLRQNGFSVAFADLRIKKQRDQFFSLIRRLKPRFIGTTMFSIGYRGQYRFLEQIKSQFPSLKVVVGGPHASCFKEKLLEECTAVDFGIVQEGDDTIVEICQGRNPHDILGLIFRDGDRVCATAARPYIQDLDRLGFPHYDEVDLRAYVMPTMVITTSRGCYGQCVFCAVAPALGRKVRMRSAGLVAEEITHWHRRGYRIFSIMDDNFLVDRERVFTLCRLLRAHPLKGLQLKLDVGVRADCVDKEVLAEMAAVGFNKIVFGVESANDHILRNIKKGETVAQIEHAIRLALEVGMQVHLFFIIGLPGETEQEVRNSHAFACRMKVHNFQFYNLMPYPCTELFEWARTNKYLLYPPEEYLNFMADSKNSSLPLIETPELSRQMREMFYRGGLPGWSTRQIKAETLGKRLGPLAYPLIWIYTSTWFQRMLNTPLVRSWVFRVRVLLRV